jgi:hypothetical protein
MCAHDEETDTMDEQSHSTNGHDKNGNRHEPETMFDSIKVAANDLAERAGPTVRDLSARAADLTATAADKAAPYVRRAGAATADASVKLAEAARGWAAELRGANPDAGAAEASSAPSATAVAEPPVDAETPAYFAQQPVVEEEPAFVPEVAEPSVAESPVADTTPSELAAEEPQAVVDTGTSPFETTAETITDEAPASPAFEEGAGTGNDEGARPGI